MKIPGLVDLQVNGYKGVDFSGAELTMQNMVRACRELLEAGTTAFLATMITSRERIYQRNLSMIADVMEQDEFKGQLLGIHLEGPFISPEPGACGVHNPEWIKRPDMDYLNKLMEWSRGNVRLMTIAAELEGAEDITCHATASGIAISLGHQMAGDEDLARLSRAGAGALTHLGNGVPAVLPRHKNPIWAGLDNDNLSAMLITDGHHLPLPVLRTFIRTKGISRCIVVSDASPVAGLPPGRYDTFGNDAILEESGRLYNSRTGYLAGSSATILQCMNYLASLGMLSAEELLTVGFLNPLKLIKVSPDSLRPGADIFYDERKRVFTVGRQ